MSICLSVACEYIFRYTILYLDCALATTLRWPSLETKFHNEPVIAAIVEVTQLPWERAWRRLPLRRNPAGSRQRWRGYPLAAQRRNFYTGWAGENLL